jgi:hypothetical protein
LGFGAAMSSFLSSVRVVSWRRDLLGLGLVFGLLFGFHLGGRPLANPDEGRYGEIRGKCWFPVIG